MEEWKNSVYNGDCLDFMKNVPDKFFDLILTDPPYGINRDSIVHKIAGELYGNMKTPKGTYYKSNWDTKIPDKQVFDEMKRISKNQIIFGGNYFVEYLNNSPCWLVWDKDNGNNSYPDCELAYTTFKTAVRKYKFLWNGMLQADMRTKEHRHHPTQKPIKLFTAILQDYAIKGMKIFDPFLGSGTTAIACNAINLDWWGCELEGYYCDIINKRLNNVQGDLLGV